MGLRMLKELLCTSRIDIDIRKFCEMYFVAHDVMGRTAWDEDVIYSEHHEWDQDESYREVCRRNSSAPVQCSKLKLKSAAKLSCRLTQSWAAVRS